MVTFLNTNKRNLRQHHQIPVLVLKNILTLIQQFFFKYLIVLLNINNDPLVMFSFEKVVILKLFRLKQTQDE